MVEQLLAGLSQSTSNLAWALQILSVLAVELGKASGGERTIALTPMMYALWCKTRKAGVRQWQQDKALPSNTAKKGSSALKAAAARSLTAEIAYILNKSVGAALFDFKKKLTQLTLRC